MVTKVIYARLYNLGNYENERLEVEVTVEGTGEVAVAEAWAGACQAVEDQHVALETARTEAARRQREEYEQRRQEAAQKAAATTRRMAAHDDSPPF